ncbi:hypothetical protein M422DRAFT_259384 [Sphaerobolus stellatus SS14]|uniref:Uncharacterized protein n=1 Tax=Sphaerobolus stellatus (strain SS14) TaxID=990650 RepID=A0A0C9U4X5_SPHS4|nr:hypothetical protein M422DRAFT_259384 [Sphaerobolus stellatus SS14]
MAPPLRGHLSFSELIRRGIPCNIAVQLDSGPMPATLDPADTSTLFLSKFNRIRPPNYAPTPADFQIYMDIRLAFLRHVRRRPALMKGGILWRLAVEAVTPERVLQTSYDYWNKEAFILVSEGTYYTHEFTEEGVNVVCGVYKVEPPEAEYMGELGPQYGVLDEFVRGVVSGAADSNQGGDCGAALVDGVEEGTASGKW